MKVLIVEDSVKVMETVADFLELEGIQVDFAYNGREAIARVQETHFDALVMDIMMPVMDGIDAVEKIRTELHCNTPILFLTARDALDDKARAYGVGGDDYLVKPFAMEELLLRLKALTKRGLRGENQTLTVGPLSLDIEREALSVAGANVKLTGLQLRILTLLMQRSPGIVTREEILETVWGDELPPSDALRSHLYAIRSTLAKAGVEDCVKTIHGRGLQLVCE